MSIQRPVPKTFWVIPPTPEYEARVSVSLDLLTNQFGFSNRSGEWVGPYPDRETAESIALLYYSGNSTDD